MWFDVLGIGLTNSRTARHAQPFWHFVEFDVYKSRRRTNPPTLTQRLTTPVACAQGARRAGTL